MTLIRALVLLLISAMPALAASSDYPPPWPSADVTVTMPFSQGSETDQLMALFRTPFTAETGKSMMERFISGQAGADAWARMRDDPVDGSVLTVVLLPNLLLRTLQPDSGVYPNRMSICHIVAYAPCALWVANSGAFDTFGAVVDAARSMGVRFHIGGPGRYSATQIANRALNRHAGINTVYIPYAGSQEAAKAALNRDVRAFWAQSVALPELGAMVKPVAVAAEKRLPCLPDTPTLRELGVDLIEGVYYGVAVPSDTPEMTRQEISAFFADVAASQAFRTGAASLGFVPLNIPLEEVPSVIAREDSLLKAKIEEYDLASQ